MDTIVPSFFIGFSFNLQVTRTGIKSRTSSNSARWDYSVPSYSYFTSTENSDIIVLLIHESAQLSNLTSH